MAAQSVLNKPALALEQRAEDYRQLFMLERCRRDTHSPVVPGNNPIGLQTSEQHFIIGDTRIVRRRPFRHHQIRLRYSLTFAKFEPTGPSRSSSFAFSS